MIRSDFFSGNIFRLNRPVLRIFYSWSHSEVITVVFENTNLASLQRQQWFWSPFPTLPCATSDLINQEGRQKCQPSCLAQHPLCNATGLPASPQGLLVPTPCSDTLTDVSLPRIQPASPHPLSSRHYQALS